MALDTAAIANAVVDVLEGLAGMGEVEIGVPESTDYRVSAYVTMGSQPNTRKATQLVQRSARIFVTFAYRVDKNQGVAELALMGLVDAFHTALYADLTLGGVCGVTEIDSGLADTPDYQLRSGKEYREYPVILTATQNTTFVSGA